jgi:SpoVK/Ycf46/Vps4 family AAA+-type ATPase
MNIIITNKKWSDILPDTSVQELLKMTDGCRQKIQPVQTGNSLPCLVLFYGDIRENKIAAAGLIAAHLQQDAYRVDTPVIVSKYIGETEKNLEEVFARAEAGNWILFFDEADALFGKRTDIKDDHDKYAGAEINYLVQRIKKHRCPVIMSVCNRDRIAAPVLKHFHTLVDFSNDKKG